MNYLAHFHLAGDEPTMIVGALLGDYVKGPLNNQYNADIRKGIRLHRSLDNFVDQHHATRLAAQLFDKKYRRYSGILLDLFFDHFLARHWARYHQQELAEFSQQVYQLLEENHLYLPAKARQFVSRMSGRDLLSSYGQREVIQQSLAHIGTRLSRENPLHHAARQMDEHYDSLEQTFITFYPEAINFANKFRDN
jgi:acyl carrier protein phosphodiesterase